MPHVRSETQLETLNFTKLIKRNNMVNPMMSTPRGSDIGKVFKRKRVLECFGAIVNISAFYK